jgi:DNA-binding CsgD family transcriptional regulator
VETGALTEAGGIWTLTGPFTAPPRLRELIAGRLEGVGPDERTVLDLLALAEPLPLDLLSEIAGGGDNLERLEARGVLVVDDSGRADARLSHPLLADVLLDAQGAVRRRRLLRRLVAAVSAYPLPVEAPDRIVRWRIDAGLDVSPGELLTTARRYVLVDPPLAESLARRALASEGGDSTAATMTLAEIMAMSGRPDEATELLAGMPSGSSRQRCRQEVDLALILAFGLNRSKDAAERLEVLLDDLDDRDWAYVAGQIPLLWLLAGEIDRALQAAQAVLADERASESDRLSAELVLIPSLNLVGKPVSALERAAEVVARVADHPAFNEYMVGQLETAVPTGHRYVGDLDRAEETALDTYDRVTRQGADMLRGVYALRLGQIALWRGALVRAEQYCLEAISALAGDALTRACAVDHVRYVRALTLRSDMPGALAPGGLYAVEHGFLSAAVEAATGDVSYARSLALGAARRGLATGHIANCVFALYEAARHGAAPAAAELARELPPIEGQLLPALVAAVEALAGHDHVRLEQAGGRLEDLGCLLHAAELIAAGATAAADQGLGTVAARLRTRAQELVEHCDGATTELLRSPVSDGLTTREREVAGFAARGLTDVEIAARLSVSRRTVETHLYRVYAKLGVSGRRDLAPLFSAGAGAPPA